MCRFITIIAPADCRPCAIAVLRQHRGWVSETNNKDLARIAPPNSVQLVSPTSGCDCGTVLDNDWGTIHSKVDQEKIAEKWRRKGWSEAKIERSLADKEHGKATTTQRGATDSFELWEMILSELVNACSSAGAVGLILHEYHGGIDDEPINPDRRRVSAAHSIIDVLRSVKEDELLLWDQAWSRSQTA